MTRARPAIVAGIFYPGSEQSLNSELERLEERVPSPAGPEADAIVVPHGAYEYIGETTAAAYLRLKRRGRTKVVLMGPLHRERGDKIVLAGTESFTLPGGELPLDLETVTRLEKCGPKIVIDDLPHGEEHCLETQLPFIYRYLPNTLLIPVLVGEITQKTAETLIEGLLTLFPRFHEETALVVTVNAAHSREREQALREADALKERMQPGNTEDFFSPSKDSPLSLCSRQCIGILLNSKLGFSKIDLVAQSVSSDLDAETRDSTVYAAYSLTKRR